MNGLWESPPDRDLPPGRLAERREHLVSEIRQTEWRTAPAPGHDGRRGLRPRLAGALAAGALAVAAIAGGAIWLSGGSGDDAVAGTTGTSQPATTAPGPVTEARGIPAVQAMLVRQPVRTVTSASGPIKPNEGGETFPYLVLDLPETDLDEAYDVVDAETDEAVGIQTVYHQWWTNEAGDTVGREILLRVQQVGQEYEWLTLLTGLAESTQTVVIEGREVTVYRIPDESIEEGSYDLDVLHWIEGPGVEAILIPWGLAGEEALDFMAGLELMDAEEWATVAERLGEAATPATTIVKDVTVTTGASDG